MRHIISILALSIALLFVPSMQSAQAHHIGVAASSGGGGGGGFVVSSHGQRFFCWANPAGVLICAVIVGITVRTIQEVQKGCTRDVKNWPPRFWMPVCDPAPRRRPVVVSVRW